MTINSPDLSSQRGIGAVKQNQTDLTSRYGTEQRSGAVKPNAWSRIISTLINRIKPVKETAASRYSGLNTGQKVAVVGGAAITAAGAIAGAGIAHQEQLKSAISNTGKGIVSAGEMLSQKAIELDNRDLNTSLQPPADRQNPALEVQQRDARMKAPQDPQGPTR